MQHEKLIFDGFRIVNYGNVDGASRFIHRIVVLPCKKAELILRVMWPTWVENGPPCRVRADHGSEGSMLLHGQLEAHGQLMTGPSKLNQPIEGTWGALNASVVVGWQKIFAALHQHGWDTADKLTNMLLKFVLIPLIQYDVDKWVRGFNSTARRGTSTSPGDQFRNQSCGCNCRDPDIGEFHNC